jgi:hypothetical protein
LNNQIRTTKSDGGLFKRKGLVCCGIRATKKRRPSQLASLAVEILPFHEMEAKKRQQVLSNGETSVPAFVPEPIKGNARDKTAALSSGAESNQP